MQLEMNMKIWKLSLFTFLTKGLEFVQKKISVVMENSKLCN